MFITPSEFVRSRMVDWGIDARRIEVVRNFTDVHVDAYVPGTYGMYLGRLSGEKGLDVLLRALARAGDPPFYIAGDGPVMASLVDLAARLELRRTEFLGRVPFEDVPSLLKGARYLALASLWDENAPLAALEAMAAARPLLVTRTGGLPELVGNGEGVACAPGDEEGLAAGIRRLAADDELCRCAGERALARARDEFSPEHHLEELERAYAKTLERPLL